MYFLFLLCAEFFSKIRHLPFKEVKKNTLLQNYYQHEHPTLFMENLLLTIKEHLFTNWFYSQKRIVHACGFFREINLRNIFPFFFYSKCSLLNDWLLEHAHECKVLLLFPWNYSWAGFCEVDLSSAKKASYQD